MSGTKAVFETLRSLASGSLTTNYQALGTPITNPSAIMKIVNNTTSTLLVSTDGVNDHDTIPAGGFTLYDISSDAQIRSGDGRLSVPANTQFYVKTTASTLVSLTTIYQGG